jgi:two-component system, chemotaxis family, protein-glutamate methylesterase/glutaminase
MDPERRGTTPAADGRPSAPTRLVVIGASAGGVEALRTLVADLPADFPACVLVTLHVPSTGMSALPTILSRAGALPAEHAREGSRLEPGRILVAPPDHHLIVLQDSVTLSHGPRENGHRPAVDVLFRSAARAHDGHVIAVVLSGALDDGAAGMVSVIRRGGTGIVQDFEDALHDSMPRAAHAAAAVEYVVPAKELSALLGALLRRPVSFAPTAPEPLLDMETAMADLDATAMHDPERPGSPSGFGCPDCHGALFEIEESELIRYRCRVGHAWSPESLLAQQGFALEGALWMALRGLEEKAALSMGLGERAAGSGHPLTASRFRATAEETLEAAELVRGLIEEIGARNDQEAS